MFFLIFTEVILICSVLFCVFYVLPRKIYKTQINILSMLENIKDGYTESHSAHVGHLCGLIHRHLPKEIKRTVNKKALVNAGRLHDIGKLFVPDDILNKEGVLTDGEYEKIKLHPSAGSKILKGTLYKNVANIVEMHHERVDGNGYYGVRDIPVESKIIAVADTFSSLVTDRVYRKGISIQAALDVIRGCSGTQFDEQIANCFLRIDISELTAATAKVGGVFIEGGVTR